MKKAEIKVGGHYTAKVSGKLTTVRVDKIDATAMDPYRVTNLATGRKVAFRSAMKFRSEAKPPFTAAEKAQMRAEAGVPVTPPADQTETDSGADAMIAQLSPAGQKQVEEFVAATKEDEQRPDPTALAASAAPATQTVQNEQPVKSVIPTATAAASTPVKPASPLAAKLAKVEDDSPHVIVVACAGTGKTTTLVEGLKELKGIGSKSTPSPQQRAVWDAICLSKGKASSVCFVAFNKSIATELQGRVPAGCDAMTMHSMGYKAVQKALGRQEPNGYVVQDVIADLLDAVDVRQLRRDKPTVLKATEDLVSLCKMNLSGTDAEELDRLCAHYEVDLDGQRAEIYRLVPQVLEACKSPKGRISFDDMIWLPVVLNLPVTRYDLLLVDEAQDLNRCQQALAKRAGKRLILCGDPKQAIYGFAGADAESMKRMEKELSGGAEFAKVGAGHLVSPKCIVLPLTVTRRCGKAIVEEARKLVPDFEAHEGNGEGRISRADFPCKDNPQPKNDYSRLVQDGDFILCRVNAPLVSQCFRFLRSGRKATIQGRDIGQGIISLIRKLKADSVVELVGKLTDWSAKEIGKEQAKRNPNEAKIIALQDKCDCLLCFCEGQDTVDGVIRKVEAVFTDDKASPGIKLSSIHKAKGLESRRVFFLMPKGAECPHPLAKSEWQYQQELNLRYVGITRAIEELCFVS